MQTQDSTNLPLAKNSNLEISDSILLKVHIPLSATISSLAPKMMPMPSDKTVSNPYRESDCMDIVLKSDHWFGFALVYCKDYSQPVDVILQFLTICTFVSLLLLNTRQVYQTNW